MTSPLIRMVFTQEPARERTILFSPNRRPPRADRGRHPSTQRMLFPACVFVRTIYHKLGRDNTYAPGWLFALSGPLTLDSVLHVHPVTMTDLYGRVDTYSHVGHNGKLCFGNRAADAVSVGVSPQDVFWNGEFTYIGPKDDKNLPNTSAWARGTEGPPPLRPVSHGGEPASPRALIEKTAGNHIGAITRRLEAEGPWGLVTYVYRAPSTEEVC